MQVGITTTTGTSARTKNKRTPLNNRDNCHRVRRARTRGRRIHVHYTGVRARCSAVTSGDRAVRLRRYDDALPLPGAGVVEDKLNVRCTIPWCTWAAARTPDVGRGVWTGRNRRLGNRV